MADHKKNRKPVFETLAKSLQNTTSPTALYDQTVLYDNNS